MTEGEFCMICGEAVSPPQEGKSVLLEGTSFSAHLKCIQALRLLLQESPTPPASSDSSSTQLISQLYSKGWFSESRTLADVMEQLKELGFNYDTSTVSNSLRNLTDNGLLSRKGKPKSYEYIQKRPPA